MGEIVVRDNEKLISELRDCAKHLSEKLNATDFEGAAELINELVDARDKSLFTSIGQLTRGLHNALVNFHVDSGLDEASKGEMSEIQDASERLNYVINKTQEAADKTMDSVEAAAPIAMNFSQEATLLKEEWEKLKRREIGPNEFRELYTRMDAFLADIKQGSDSLNNSFQDILLAQDFQDLTGQVIKRVITLVTDVEKELVGLVRIAAEVEDITGMVVDHDLLEDEKRKETAKEAEGPQVHADIRDDVVSGQDDVDDLLSSLGF